MQKCNMFSLATWLFSDDRWFMCRGSRYEGYKPLVRQLTVKLKHMSLLVVHRARTKVFTQLDPDNDVKNEETHGW